MSKALKYKIALLEYLLTRFYLINPTTENQAPSIDTKFKCNRLFENEVFMVSFPESPNLLEPKPGVLFVIDFLPLNSDKLRIKFWLT